jgi:HSP20 family protein
MDEELQVQRKREVETREESTIPARAFVPVTDIFETVTLPPRFNPG